jgi:alkylhydroperoxidase/carboxymuconolactone decarboxylase family protein YurZ
VPPSNRVARTPEDRIAEGDQVRLQYKNRQLFVIAIKVVAPQERETKGAYRDL